MQNQQDQALLAAFHLMTAGERSFLLQTAQTLTEDRRITRPRLTLVPTSGTLFVGALRRGHGG